MKLRILIPICIVILAIGVTVGILIGEYVIKNNLSDDQTNSVGIQDIDPQLQIILDHCESHGDAWISGEELVFQDGTRHIDNIDCEWHEGDHLDHDRNPDFIPHSDRP